MRLLKLIPDATSIDFIGHRRILLTIAATLVAASLAVFLVRGLNLGIDFLGGVLIEAQTEGPAPLEQVRARLKDAALGDVSIQSFGAPDVVLIRVQRQSGGEDAQQAVIAGVKTALDGLVREYRRAELVGPTVGAELRRNATWAVLAAIVGMLGYIWLRFEWQFGVAAIIALTHDVLVTLGLFAVLQLEFNLSTVAALLTIAGYSVNDTVIVFDAIREDLRKYKKTPLPALFNLAINRTLSRTVVTGLTTLLAVLALAIFGGDVIRSFSVAMVWGILVGTFSSIAIASPLLLFFPPARGEDRAVVTPAAS